MTNMTRESLRRRAELVGKIRNFFDRRDFIEVWPRCITSHCVVDPYIDPLETVVRAGGDRVRQFLQPSPEAEMKRMLADRSGSIYSIGPAFRDDESGDWHRPEFTMLEWYEVGADMRGGIETISDLSALVLGSPCRVMSYRDAFAAVTSVDPIEASTGSLAALVGDADLARSLGEHRDDVLDVVMSTRIMPTLIEPTIIHDYPLSQAALAKPSERDENCAARFEWFAGGVELGNGYDELLDVDELINRTKIANERRIAAGREALPPPTPLIDAMRRGLPAAAGVAVGIDRLLMVASGECRI